MPSARPKRLVCHHCSVPLTKDAREHELIVTFRSDPDHPDVEPLFSGPVDLGLVRPSGE